MRRVTASTLLINTFHATLTSVLSLLASLVVLQTLLVSSASAEVTFLNMWGSEGAGDGKFDGPRGVAVSGTGQVYVADRENYRIQRFDADGTYQLQWGSYGNAAGEFHYPYGVAVSGTGQVYVADRENHRIQRFDADGTAQLQWGSPGSAAGEFDLPWDVAVSGTGQLYWLGNITAQPPGGRGCAYPRYPLVIAEVDESGPIPSLKKNTITMIDDRQTDEPEGIEFSNFTLLENREAHTLDLYIVVKGHSPTKNYKYTVTFQ